MATSGWILGSSIKKGRKEVGKFENVGIFISFLKSFVMDSEFWIAAM